MDECVKLLNAIITTVENDKLTDIQKIECIKTQIKLAEDNYEYE